MAGRLLSWLFLAGAGADFAPAVPARRLLGQELTASSRLALLAGLEADSRAKTQTVCACLSIDEAAIREAIAEALPESAGRDGRFGDIAIETCSEEEDLVVGTAGAIAAGDIGAHFPPSQSRWKGAESALFVREALRLVRRAGYAVAKEPFMTALRKIVLYSTNGVTTPVQYAMIEALKTTEDEIARHREEYRKRRDLLVSALNEVGLDCEPPAGAFYAFPNTSKLYGKKFNGREIASSADPGRCLLEEAKGAPGSRTGFGEARYLMPSYGTA